MIVHGSNHYNCIIQINKPVIHLSINEETGTAKLQNQ